MTASQQSSGRADQGGSGRAARRFAGASPSPGLSALRGASPASSLPLFLVRQAPGSAGIGPRRSVGGEGRSSAGSGSASNTWGRTRPQRHSSDGASHRRAPACGRAATCAWASFRQRCTSCALAAAAAVPHSGQWAQPPHPIACGAAGGTEAPPRLRRAAAAPRRSACPAAWAKQREGHSGGACGWPERAVVGWATARQRHGAAPPSPPPRGASRRCGEVPPSVASTARRQAQCAARRVSMAPQMRAPSPRRATRARGRATLAECREEQGQHGRFRAHGQARAPAWAQVGGGTQAWHAASTTDAAAPSTVSELSERDSRRTALTTAAASRCSQAARPHRADRRKHIVGAAHAAASPATASIMRRTAVAQDRAHDTTGARGRTRRRRSAHRAARNARRTACPRSSAADTPAAARESAVAAATEAPVPHLDGNRVTHCAVMRHSIAAR